MKAKVEVILNLFPEVVWDRWTGELEAKPRIGVFGWLKRDDGKSDFVFLIIDNRGVCLSFTSSAKHSADFSNRLGLTCHNPCKRVEDHFENVNAIHLMAKL